MKKYFDATLVAISLLAAGCTQEQKEIVSDIVITPQSVEIAIGGSASLTAEVEPAGTTVDWESADPGIAIVDASGKVFAQEIGSTDIIATAAGKSARCKVTVVGVPVSAIVLSKNTLDLTEGEEADITARILPEDADTKSVTWSSSDESVAAIDGNGHITANGIGTADIIAKAGNVEAVCKLTVSGIPVENIELDSESFGIKVGESRRIEAAVSPDNAHETTIEWTSSNTAVASIEPDGTVTGKKIGIATITAKAGGKKAECLVSVMGEPALGDFYYSDGTYSSTLYFSKKPIGVIFWLGDPAEDDEAMKREHPECTHGLVVSLEETTCAWQGPLVGCVGEWIKENPIGYMSPVTTTDGSEPYNMNKKIGYNNTKAIEIFNESNPEALVEAVNKVKVYNITNPAPQHTTGWYLPSAKELIIMSGGDYDGDIWNIYKEVPLEQRTQNYEFLNSRIGRISGATQISDMYYWSSSEEDPFYAFYIFFSEGSLSRMTKGSSGTRVRYILAF